MSNIHILDTIVTLDGTLSGGSWLSTLPLLNLQNEEPQKIARSANALAASTLFVCDLGRALPVSLFALINNNLSADATVRWRLSDQANLSSPLIDVTTNVSDPNIEWGSLQWGVFPWTGFTEDTDPTGGQSLFYQHTSTELGRYIGVDITDTANADGYVQAGVFAAGDPFVPTINMAFGAGLAVVDPSRQTRAVGGALYTDSRPKFRTFTATLGFLTETEARSNVYRMRRALGISGGLLLIIDPEETGEILQAGTIYGRFSRVDDPIRFENPVEYPYSATIEIEERL